MNLLVYQDKNVAFYTVFKDHNSFSLKTSLCEPASHLTRYAGDRFYSRITSVTLRAVGASLDGRLLHYLHAI